MQSSLLEIAYDQRKRMKAQVARTSVALCQGEGRQFESGRPLENPLITGGFFLRALFRSLRFGHILAM